MRTPFVAGLSDLTW